MTEVIIRDLKPSRYPLDDYFRERINKSFKKGILVKELEPGAYTYHNNYLGYLCACWESHHGAIIDPVYLWQMILCELAIIVKDTPEAYRSHFTDSTEKKEILIPTNDSVQINVQVLCEELRGLIKEDIDVFLPDFSTHTGNSKFAHAAAFCDALSPFYNYGMYLCGIPKVRIMGTEQDWALFRTNLEKLKAIFPTKAEWLDNIIGIDFASTDPEFWDSMLTLEKCGSGHQFKVSGWITKIFINKPDFALPENFSLHVSEVSYKNITTKKSYVLFSGLFSSTEVDDYLIPQYSVIINDMTEDDNTPVTIKAGHDEN